LGLPDLISGIWLFIAFTLAFIKNKLYISKSINTSFSQKIKKKISSTLNQITNENFADSMDFTFDPAINSFIISIGKCWHWNHFTTVKIANQPQSRQ
jgi:hypothetical protein